jgi:hypothetical protein
VEILKLASVVVESKGDAAQLAPNLCSAMVIRYSVLSTTLDEQQMEVLVNV